MTLYDPTLTDDDIPRSATADDAVRAAVYRPPGAAPPGIPTGAYRAPAPDAPGHLAVRAGDTIRLLTDTVSTEHRAPDGGIRFPRGLVVLVDDHYLDAPTARRWVRNRIAEPYPGGTHGDVVTDAERVADTTDFDAQIARLEHLRARAVARAEEIRAREAEAAEAAVAAGYVPVVRHRDPEAPIGIEPYRVPGGEDPLAAYGLDDYPLLALKYAGYRTPEQIDAATDEELLEIKGVGTATLERLRGRRT